MKRTTTLLLWCALLGAAVLTGGCRLHHGEHEMKIGNYKHHW